MSLEGFSSRFPHSDISGSMDICSSPKLFAAYHVFHRLLVPRHPPCALFCLTSRRIALRLLGLLHFHMFLLPWRASLKSSSLYPYKPAFTGPYGLGCLDICFVQYAVFKVRIPAACLFPSCLPGTGFPASGDGEIRTLDPLLARQVLSQLSYTPTAFAFWFFGIQLT